MRELTFIIDTREQLEYKFPKSVTKKLDAGDYSIVGFENRVAIERKSKADAYGSLGNGRRRFERVLQRLARMDFAAIVIESSVPDFLKAPAYTKMNPAAALNSILAWSVKYKVFLYFAGDRPHGNALTQRLLEKYFKYHGENNKGGDNNIGKR